MDTSPPLISHSPQVHLWLECGQQMFKLRQVAPDWIIPDTSFAPEINTATVVVEIDGQQHRRRVTLPVTACHRGECVKVMDGAE